MKIGYNEACGLGCSTLDEDLRLTEAAGFDIIEIRYDMLRDYLTTHTIGELEEFFATSSVRPGPLNATYIYPEFLSENDDGARRDALLSEFITGCTVAQRIGAPSIVVVPPLQRDPQGGPYVGSVEDTNRECVRILSQLADIAADYGVGISFEPVGFDRSSVRSIAQASQIVAAVNRPNVGFTIDSYNIFLNGGSNDFSAIAEMDGSLIHVAHLMNADDVPESERSQDKRCFPGPGAVDLDAFLTALKESGFDGIVSVETFRPEYWEKSPEWVVKSAFTTTRDCLEINNCL